MEQFLYNIEDLAKAQGVSDKDERILRENGWIRGINRGDKKSFEALYRFYYLKLAQFALRYVKSEQVAEDVTHNVFSKVWEKRESIKPQGTFRSYLYTAVRNQCFKSLKKNGLNNHVCITENLQMRGKAIFPEEDIEYKEFVNAFRNAVSKLPDRRRHIFLLHREDKLTYREIAEVLEISIKTVETQMSLSLKFLSEKLNHFRY